MNELFLREIGGFVRPSLPGDTPAAAGGDFDRIGPLKGIPFEGGEEDTKASKPVR